MTREQWNEACKFTNSQLHEWQVEETLHFIKNRMSMPGETAGKIHDLMDEWCRDHDLDQDEWLEWGCEEDVFFNE